MGYALLVRQPGSVFFVSILEGPFSRNQISLVFAVPYAVVYSSCYHEVCKLCRISLLNLPRPDVSLSRLSKGISGPFTQSNHDPLFLCTLIFQHHMKNGRPISVFHLPST